MRSKNHGALYKKEMKNHTARQLAVGVLFHKLIFYRTGSVVHLLLLKCSMVRSDVVCCRLVYLELSVSYRNRKWSLC